VNQISVGCARSIQNFSSDRSGDGMKLSMVVDLGHLPEKEEKKKQKMIETTADLYLPKLNSIRLIRSTRLELTLTHSFICSIFDWISKKFTTVG
jgi:hypothetical protein